MSDIMEKTWNVETMLHDAKLSRFEKTVNKQDPTSMVTITFERNNIVAEVTEFWNVFKVKVTDNISHSVVFETFCAPKNSGYDGNVMDKYQDQMAKLVPLDYKEKVKMYNHLINLDNRLYMRKIQKLMGFSYPYPFNYLEDMESFIHEQDRKASQKEYRDFINDQMNHGKSEMEAENAWSEMEYWMNPNNFI